MATLYQATLTPTKIELLQAWVPTQEWFDGSDGTALEAVGAFRFDDPDGEVGIETHLLRSADGQTLHVPITYRGAPLADAESSLVGTADHSVLGQRWVYDGCGDPAYVRALATAILTGGREADVEIVTDTGPQRVAAQTHVRGTGSAETAVPSLGSATSATEGTVTVITTDGLQLFLSRVLDPHAERAVPDGEQRLTGTWPGQEAPALLAHLKLG
jgi:hypothetical protein